MRVMDNWHENRCFGSSVVGPRGQMVIPAGARRELGIDVGATLLVFEFFHGRGLMLLKADAAEQMLSMLGEQLSSFEKLVKNYRSQKAASGKKGG